MSEQPWYRSSLACPDCQLPLASELAGTSCACGFTLPQGTPPDLRPQNPRDRDVRVHIGTRAFDDLARVDITRPKPTYSGARAMRDSSELFSAAEPHLTATTKLLDLGCGPRDQAVAVAHYGASYVGVDYSSPDADLRADAHVLPFADASFDAVLSYAVFEHLYDPAHAAREVRRVLKSGGIFFGAVSQGEPYHESFFHHTALGVLSIFAIAGFEPLRLWPSYDTLHSLAEMGRYPRAQRMLIEATYRFGRAFPFLAPRKFFRGTEREKALDELHRAASICFVARRR